MNLRPLVAALLAAPLMVQAQSAPPTDTPSNKSAAKAASKDAIATVNGVPVPKARADLLVLQQQARGTPDSAQTRAAVRENLINREVVSQEAQKSGVGKSAAIRHQLEMARQQIMIDAYIANWLKKNPVSDAELKKEYERVKAQQGDKEYKARHILVETEEQAKKLIAEIKDGGKFDELASRSSMDPGTKERGGDLDWNTPAVFDKAFSDAMVKLDKGEYTEAPVRSRFGYHVIRLDDVRDVKFPSFEEVKPRIQQQLVQNRVNEMVKGLRAKAKIE
jgi:peptidyl-prolyl cis-trans isomerase C